jgi:hypothetical protein
VVFAASQAVEEAPVGETGPIPTFKQGIRFDTFDLNFCKVNINSNPVKFYLFHVGMGFKVCVYRSQ